MRTRAPFSEYVRHRWKVPLKKTKQERSTFSETRKKNVARLYCRGSLEARKPDCVWVDRIPDVIGGSRDIEILYEGQSWRAQAKATPILARST